MKSSTRGGEVTRGVRLLKSPQETTIAGGGGGGLISNQIQRL